MRILGINDHITSGAALIEDGRVLAAVNEERLVRKKMVIGFPWESIGAVLDIAGLRPNDIDCIAVASKTGHFLDKYVSVDNGVFTLDEGFTKSLLFSVGAYAGFLRNRIPALEDIYYGVKQPIFARRRRQVPKVLQTNTHSPVQSSSSRIISRMPPPPTMRATSPMLSSSRLTALAMGIARTSTKSSTASGTTCIRCLRSIRRAASMLM